MKLIQPSFEILEQDNTLEGIYRQIERAGRTCYKSEDKITRDSAKKFVDMLITNGHTAMLEHGTVYLQINHTSPLADDNYMAAVDSCVFYDRNKFSTYYRRCTDGFHVENYITTNYRVIVENHREDDLKYICEPTEFHEKRYTVKFITDIGVTREYNRHRVNSMAEQSTRYCNYSKEKFGSELSICPSSDLSEDEINQCITSWGNGTQNSCFRWMCTQIALNKDEKFAIVDTWLFSNLAAEWSYRRLIELGWKPQQARRVLPLDLKSELVHTATASDWKHFFELRCDSHAHPQAQELAIPLKEEFISRGYI